MTTLQILGAMLVGGMLFGWPFALLILRLVENDARYPEPATPHCIHPMSWAESRGVEPDSQLRLCVRVRCTMCGDERLLPFQAPHYPPRNAADVLPFAGHASTMHERPFAVLSESQRDRQAPGVSSVRA